MSGRTAASQPEAARAGCAVRWLLVHDLHDAAADWLGACWRDALPPSARDALWVLPAPALNLHARFSVRVQGGRTHSRVSVQLPGAAPRCLDSGQLQGVLWRAAGAWMPAAPAHASLSWRAEQAYQAQERHALLLAWLHGLGPACVNRPRGDSLAGAAWRPAVWRAMASRAGLPVWPQDVPVAQQQALVLVGGGQVVDLRAAPGRDGLAQGAVRLADSEGCAELLLTGLQDLRGQWHVCGADARPDLRLAGPSATRLVQAMARRMGMPTSLAQTSEQVA